ncbi:MAG: hypothetical protein CGW95_01840 [Phenylobacterium zucineum]|nr:MAG: hypothetical protein CGW95_01840 [Phenylobacterium zucineum]
MLKYIFTYLGTGMTFAAIDLIWLTHSGALYRPTLDPVLADQVNYPAAIAFYALYILGLVVMAVVPAGKAGTWRLAASKGAMLGAFAYATYDLTNQATLKVWATAITLADISWGTFVTGAGCSLGYVVWRWSAKRFG